MEGTHSVPCRVYWIAWFVLLAITVAMVYTHHPAVLLLGMAVKASIIMAWFMHLKYERFEFALGILVSIFATGMILFGLLVPDGLAM